MSKSKLGESHTVFRIPKSHWHCHLWNFDWDVVKPVRLREIIYKFTKSVALGTPTHLILMGEPGRGKSHLGVGLYRHFVTVFGTERVTWINVPAFFDRVKRGYDDDSAKHTWEDLEHAKNVVVLDDLFAREFTQHEKDHIVSRILDTIIQNNAALVCTMNPDIEGVKLKLPMHEYSRLFANSTVVAVSSNEDYRLTAQRGV